jgi:uncharacterized protein with HEPN domain
MRGPRGDRERLLDILEALEAIGRHPEERFEDFMANELVRFFAAKHIEIIGEAACKISDDFKADHPDVPWRGVEKTRHVLVHDYFEIDWNKVWTILETQIEPLRVQVEAILRDMDCHDSGDV